MKHKVVVNSRYYPESKTYNSYRSLKVREKLFSDDCRQSDYIAAHCGPYVKDGWLLGFRGNPVREKTFLKALMQIKAYTIKTVITRTENIQLISKFNKPKTKVKL